jgi:hypothetical protein
MMGGTAVREVYAAVYAVEAHFCEDNAVRELDGWTFDGNNGDRCALCLQKTKPGRPWRGDTVVPS